MEAEPFSPRSRPFGNAPLPVEGSGAGPDAPRLQSQSGARQRLPARKEATRCTAIGAPEERLVAELGVQVSRRAHEINARRAKRRRVSDSANRKVRDARRTDR